MLNFRLSLLLAACLLMTGTQARAEGWLTGWLPGGDKSEKKTSRFGLLDGKPLRSTSRSSAAKEPSLWQRFSTGTRKFVDRTKDALTPGDGDSESERPSGRHFNWDDPPRKASRKKDEPSFWTRLFKRNEPRPSKTIQGFLSQERPEDAVQ